MAENKSWLKYWENRTRENRDYYGKKGSNADEIIKLLNLNQKDNVLDIGCGFGSFLIDITNKTGAKSYGIDISPIAVKLNKDTRIKLKVADMHKLPYKEGFFTKIFSLGTVEHTPKTVQVFSEINRTLKKGGKIFITVPNKISFFHLTKRLKMLFGLWDQEIGYEKSFTRGEIRALLERTGFKLDKFWVTPHLRIANPFNLADNILNKVSNKKFGFFVYFVATKVANADKLKDK